MKSDLSKLSNKLVRVNYLYKILGNVLISEENIDTLCETLNVSKCRYKSVCLRSDSVKAMYAIIEMFPELTKEAIATISREYIKDLFDNFSYNRRNI